MQEVGEHTKKAVEISDEVTDLLIMKCRRGTAPSTALTGVVMALVLQITANSGNLEDLKQICEDVWRFFDHERLKKLEKERK